MTEEGQLFLSCEGNMPKIGHSQNLNYVENLDYMENIACTELSKYCIWFSVNKLILVL